MLIDKAKKNFLFPVPRPKKIREGRKKKYFKNFFFINLEHVCNNEKNENIHSLWYVNEDLKFPNVFVLLIDVMYIISQQQAVNFFFNEK